MIHVAEFDGALVFAEENMAMLSDIAQKNHGNDGTPESEVREKASSTLQAVARRHTPGRQAAVVKQAARCATAVAAMAAQQRSARNAPALRIAWREVRKSSSLFFRC